MSKDLFCQLFSSPQSIGCLIPGLHPKLRGRVDAVAHSLILVKVDGKCRFAGDIAQGIHLFREMKDHAQFYKNPFLTSERLSLEQSHWNFCASLSRAELSLWQQWIVPKPVLSAVWREDGLTLGQLVFQLQDAREWRTFSGGLMTQSEVPVKKCGPRSWPLLNCREGGRGERMQQREQCVRRHIVSF